MLVPVLVGAVVGGLFVRVAARHGARRRLQLLAIGLAVAALIYLALAGLGGGGRQLAIEAGGVGLFTGLAWLGSAAAPVWLAVGWAAHAGWDIGLHLERPQTFVPAWYPLFCVGLDLVVAGYALGLGRPAPPSRGDAAPAYE